MGLLLPKIVAADFIKSAKNPKDYPKHQNPEFAFAGRSNVGKSSLINTVLMRKKLAKTSNTPGRTQTLNFFQINHDVMFVDLPGYGYAKAPLHVREEFVWMISEYLKTRENLCAVVVILDIRRDPSDQDVDFLKAVRFYERDVILVATKIDKCRRLERTRQMLKIPKMLDLPEDAILPFSSLTQEGRLPLLKRLEAVAQTWKDLKRS